MQSSNVRRFMETTLQEQAESGLKSPEGYGPPENGGWVFCRISFFWVGLKGNQKAPAKRNAIIHKVKRVGKPALLNRICLH